MRRMLEPFLNTATLLFVLLNPFLMAVYLLDLIHELPLAAFRRVLTRATLIAGGAFLVFAATGDALFKDVFQVRFASFLVFGGIIFLVIGLRFVMSGTSAIAQIRGPAEHVAGSIAMPFMVGPGTVSASILAGARMPIWLAALSIASGLVATAGCVLVLKAIYDRVAASRQELVTRYIDITGRVSALLIGTIAVDMILRGMERWIREITLAG